MLILKFSFFKFPAKTGLCYNMHVTYAFVTTVLNEINKSFQEKTQHRFSIPCSTSYKSEHNNLLTSLIHVPNFGNSD